MNELEINAKIETLQIQRNEALDAVAAIRAQLVVCDAERKKLQAEIEVLKEEN